jgi:divalent metal cation (Fe/Co/Zn/Cd) transporter
VGYLVLAVSALVEGTSLVQAIRHVRAEKAKDDLPLRAYLRRSDDPTVMAVLYEDSAAVVGLFLAFAGLGLTQLTGSPVWDGVASLLIGSLLVLVAYLLGRTNKSLLVGQQADRRLVAAIRERLEAQPEIEVVVDLLTMLTGTDRVLVCARLDFTDEVSSDEMERACVRIDDEPRRPGATAASAQPIRLGSCRGRTQIIETQSTRGANPWNDICEVNRRLRICSGGSHPAVSGLEHGEQSERHEP